MTAEEALRTLHFLALFYALAGLGAVMVPIYRSWFSKDVERQTVLWQGAAEAEGALLVPGLLLTGVTGFLLGVELDLNFLTTGWLATLLALYLVTVVICLPMMDLGLRRARHVSLQAAKRGGTMTPELQEALADNVPLVFGTLIVLLVPVMTWLAVFRPY